MVIEGINGSWCGGEESGGRGGCEGASWGRRRKESDMWDRMGRKDDGAGLRGTRLKRREQGEDQEEREGDEGEERARVVAYENCQRAQ